MKRYPERTEEQFMDEINLNSEIYDHLNSIIKLDRNGNLITYNQAFAKQFGYNKDDFDKPFLDVFIQYESSEQKQFLSKAILGKMQSFDTLGRCKDERIIDINVTLFPVETNIIVIVKDITELKRQEKEEALLKKNLATFDDMNDICHFYYDVVNDQHQASKQLPHFFEMNEAKNKPITLDELLHYVHPSDRDVVNNTIQNAIKTKSGYELEYKILRSDQTIRYVYETAEIILDQNGFPEGFFGMIQDIKNRKISDLILAHQLVDSDQFYRSLFENNLGMVFFVDTNGDIVKTNDQFLEALGYSNKEIVLSSVERFIPSSEISKFKSFIKTVLSGDQKQENTVFLHKTGIPIQILIEGIPAFVNGRVIGMFLIATDVTEAKKIEVELTRTELKFKSMVEQAFIGLYIIEEDGHISYGNRKFYQILGEGFTEKLRIWNYIHPDDQRSQKSIFDHLKNGEDGVDHSFRMVRKDGVLIDIEAHSKKVYFENNRPTIVGTLQDVTERKKTEDLNKFLAYHDPLTDLPNRRLFQEKLERSLDVSKTLQSKLAVMYIDLDRFKYINDTLGHSVGDLLLKKISTRIKELLGENDVLARLGGDEFAVLLPNINDINRVIEYSKNMIKSLEDPFFIQKYELFVTASIGISIFPNDGEDSKTILMHADSALYKAKDKGRNTYHIYTSSMDADSYKLLTLESDLRKVLELNQLELYYQPKIHVRTNQIVGAEALVRWNHPKLGLISPREFIPLAEETGIIKDIGKWVKEKACIQNKEWQDAGLPAIPISVNASAHRFLEKDLLVNIGRILAKTALDPKYLEIEITESFLLANEEVVLSVLDELRNIGIRISLDDFGTGYSSLSYLMKFKGKIDTLKMDQSFINGLRLTDSEGSNFITKTIIELAHHLNMDVVAEGVETVEQQEILKEYKCDTIQGYLYSKPVPANEFAALLKKRTIKTPQKSDKK